MAVNGEKHFREPFRLQKLYVGFPAQHFINGSGFRVEPYINPYYLLDLLNHVLVGFLGERVPIMPLNPS